MNLRIESKDLQKLWKIAISEQTSSLIDSFNLEYEEVDNFSQKETLFQIYSDIDSRKFDPSSPGRLPIWERGWGENLENYLETKDLISLIPKYFGKYQLNRFRQTFVRAKSLDYELNMLRAIQAAFIAPLLDGVFEVHEFGCGTGHNLIYLNGLLPGRRFTGLDWSLSSQKLLKAISDNSSEIDLNGRRFDLFNPDASLPLDRRVGVFTVAALEQLGGNHRKFLHFLVEKRPAVIVHIEPFQDLLDVSNDLDRASLSYMRSRNYIWGYVEAVKTMASQGKAEILELKRSYVGSLYVDGYTVMAWRPR